MYTIRNCQHFPTTNTPNSDKQIHCIIRSSHDFRIHTFHSVSRAHTLTPHTVVYKLYRCWMETINNKIVKLMRPISTDSKTLVFLLFSFILCFTFHFFAISHWYSWAAVLSSDYKTQHFRFATRFSVHCIFFARGIFVTKTPNFPDRIFVWFTIDSAECAPSIQSFACFFFISSLACSL